MSASILAISYFFHLIATVVWLGGLLILSLLVMPAARRAIREQPQAEALWVLLRKRFYPLTNLSLIVLLFTGLIQMAGDPNYDGVLQFSNEWSRVILYKHLAIGGMVVCGIVLQAGVAPALERAALLSSRGKGDPVEGERLRRRESRLTWASLVLGALVLAFTAWATAL